jgi:hypothetical protein
MRTFVEQAHRIFSSTAYMVMLLSGLLTVTMERYLFRRRNYPRDAAVTAVFGWTYIIGGTLFYILVACLYRMLI